MATDEKLNYGDHSNGGWVLVVEDEPRLRDELVALLATLAPDFGEIRAFGSAEEALLACQEGAAHAAPHCAFVDINLPGQSGLELAQALPDETRVVFVTAYDAFAIPAFDRGAVDYMLKPLSSERLQRSIDRLRNRITLPSGDLQPVLRDLPQLQPKLQPVAYLRWLAASAGRRTQLVAVDDVVFLQSDNKYTRVVSRNGEHLIEESLKTLLQKLDPAVFLQVHRSTVVNLREVLMVERDESGAGLIQLRNNPDVLRISAPFLRAFKAFLA